ncbi:hypothetical protein TNCV_2367601 [Trichonephila clavipes]|nr:hypothetical protein TNCV_2367601 [Trichonephila clavipes]
MRPPNEHVPYSFTSSGYSQPMSSRSADMIIHDTFKSTNFVLPVEISKSPPKMQKSNIEISCHQLKNQKTKTPNVSSVTENSPEDQREEIWIQCFSCYL